MCEAPRPRRPCGSAPCEGLPQRRSGPVRVVSRGPPDRPGGRLCTRAAARDRVRAAASRRASKEAAAHIIVRIRAGVLPGARPSPAPFPMSPIDRVDAVRSAAIGPDRGLVPFLQFQWQKRPH